MAEAGCVSYAYRSGELSVSPVTRRISTVGAIAVMAAVFWMTLTPAYGPTAVLDFWCMACGQLGGVDVVANIIMFTPVGFTLAVAMNRRWVPLAICVLTTVLIEMLQIKVVPGRDASFSDIVANSLGGLVGVELAVRRHRYLWPDPRAARRLTLMWCGVYAAICGATAWGLRPAFVPRSLWVQWDPPRAGYLPFTGRILAFDINSIDLPSGFPRASLGLDKRLMSDNWLATATISREALRPRPSVVIRISEEVTQPFALEQLDWDLTCLQKTKAAELRLRSPRVALRDAFREPTGADSDTLYLVCQHRDRSLVAAAHAGHGEPREEVLRLSPSIGWNLLSPFDIPLSTRTRWIGVLWLLALMLPAGYWWAATFDGRSRSAHDKRLFAMLAVSATASLVLGLAIAPAIARTASGAWWEWAAAVAGIGSGWLARRLAMGVLPAIIRAHRPTIATVSTADAEGR